MNIKNGRLYFDSGLPAAIVGPGDPEGFLYEPSLALPRINKLIANGGNSVYWLVVRSHGGDGGVTENPYIGNVPSSGVDDAVISSWVPWFDLCLANDILIYIQLYDDGANPYNNLGSVIINADEQAFMTDLMNKFGTYANVIWGYMEEGDLAFTQPGRITNAVTALKNRTSQLIGIHESPRPSPSAHGQDVFVGQIGDFLVTPPPPILDDINVDAAAIKLGGNAADMAAVAWEIHPAHGSSGEAQARQMTWATLMANLTVMVLGWDITNTAVAELNQARYAQLFFENVPSDLMLSNNSMAASDTNYVMNAANGLVAYSRNLTTSMGVDGVTLGTYDQLWMDTVSGASQTAVVEVTVANNLFIKPSGYGTECVLSMVKQGGILLGDTVTEIATAVDVRHLIADNYHVCLQQLRETKVFLESVVKVALEGSPTQSDANVLLMHLAVVHVSASSYRSIQTKAVGQQAVARTEQGDATYEFDLAISTLGLAMQSTYNVATVITTPYLPATLLTALETTQLLDNVNVILARY